MAWIILSPVPSDDEEPFGVIWQIVVAGNLSAATSCATAWIEGLESDRRRTVPAIPASRR
eukprot:16237810-Heterocapsa_arctica.AAC.1